VCECGWRGKNINSVISHVMYSPFHEKIEIYRPGVEFWSLEKVPENIRNLVKSREVSWKHYTGVLYTPRNYICKEHLKELKGRQKVLQHLEKEHDIVILCEKMIK